jgi:uncharacterized protein (UPF0548 family)
MFLARRPSAERIDRFLRESRDLPVSYNPIGIVKGDTALQDLDEARVAIGRGKADFERAREALMTWRQFNIGWVETFPEHAPIVVGTEVAVLMRHLGFWSLNGCRVLYLVNGSDDVARFGFAYGTLTNHAEHGEELFEVFIDPRTDDVIYRIRASSWPQATLARIGQPIVRVLQARFRDQSAAAMKRAVTLARPDTRDVQGPSSRAAT